MNVTAHEVFVLSDGLIKVMEAMHRQIPDDLELLRNEAEYAIRCDRPDPAQLDLRERLEFMARHGETLVGVR